MKIPAVCIAFVALAMPAMGHDASHHVSSQVEMMPAEILSISNIPVTDSTYKTKGFIDRFSSAGSLVLSFTYTDCETLCPVTNAILAEVDHRAGGRI